MILFLPLLFLLFSIMFAVNAKLSLIILSIILFLAFSLWLLSFVKKVLQRKKEKEKNILIKRQKDELLNEILPLLSQIKDFLGNSEVKNSNLYLEFSKLNSYLLKLKENIIQKKNFEQSDKEYFKQLKIDFDKLQKHRALEDFKLLEVFDA